MWKGGKKYKIVLLKLAIIPVWNFNATFRRTAVRETITSRPHNGPHEAPKTLHYGIEVVDQK